ncbi:tetratricopeptide repeat protein [Leptolyngbya sp. KIOST-1]|uniref:tetratricopeptide repeat protein n=1 Tax=Leptolyngbya sp. KIOST-1 TaxID=1229172 RepID=UPI00056B8B1F|nr:tetratricopeptide repeat protein [Leptolyngbya sp. KIOST-1]
MAQPYQTLIDDIVAATLKGKIQSKQQVYRMLQAGVEPGSGELFERTLAATLAALEPDLAPGDDEFKHAKAVRKHRALRTIQGEWQRWQADNQATAVTTGVAAEIVNAPLEDRLFQLVAALDPNRDHPLSREQLVQLAQGLKQAPEPAEAAPATEAVPALATLADGLEQGLAAWQQLEGEVVGWIYAQGQQIGFSQPGDRPSPWQHWGRIVSQPALKRLFEDLALHQTVTAAGVPMPLGVADWVAWGVVLQRLQLALVNWFDRQPYDPQAGKRLSIATFLTFAVVWGQISNRLGEQGQRPLARGSFQLVLQGLRQFANQSYFPLYGGLFTALSGEPLRALLDYLDRPLQDVANTAVKARILTLLGYSQRALGNYRQAQRFHQQALEVAREANDMPCEIASLNHLSRTCVAQQDFEAAQGHSQRALILARQSGDRIGQANALANLGYSQVAQGQTQLLETEQYETVLSYLEQGLALSEQVGDRPSQALCANSLGIAQLKLGQYRAAIDSLQQGLQVAQAIGDRYLMASNFAHMAAAHQGDGNLEQAVLTGCLGMYLLHQIDSPEWRQPAALLSILYGQLGPDTFEGILADHRRQFLAVIGVDGYDFLQPLLARYRESLE